VVLGSGEFGWNETRLTAAMLALFLVSLVAQSIMLLLIRAFYAGGNTRTPLLIALSGTLVTVFSAVSLQWAYKIYPALQNFIEGLFRLEGVIGIEVLPLALSFVIGVIFEMVLLLFFATRYFGFAWFSLYRQIAEAFAASLVAAISAYATLIFIVEGIIQETLIGIFLQGLMAGLMGIGGAVLTYYVLKSQELKEIYSSFKSKLFKTDVIAPQTTDL
jgi:peptidoglycan biosynthesis protein MviN/MurJ (putative lipid II flippase)